MPCMRHTHTHTRVTTELDALSDPDGLGFETISVCVSRPSSYSDVPTSFHSLYLLCYSYGWFVWCRECFFANYLFARQTKSQSLSYYYVCISVSVDLSIVPFFLFFHSLELFPNMCPCAMTQNWRWYIIVLARSALLCIVFASRQLD